MSASSTSRAAAQAPLSQSAAPSRVAKGYRVIRSARLAATTPTPGLLGRLWQRLLAAFQVTPQQWHAWQTNRKAALGGDGLRVLVLSDGHLALVSSPNPVASPRRSSQADLP